MKTKIKVAFIISLVMLTFCSATILASDQIVQQPPVNTQIVTQCTQEELAQSIAIFNIINSYRIQNNIQPLIWAQDCAQVANLRAKEIDIKYSHERPDGRRCYTAFEDVLKDKSRFSSGENIVEAYRYTDAYLIFDSWKNSPPHNELMLKSCIVYGAVGTYITPDGMWEYTLEVRTE